MNSADQIAAINEKYKAEVAAAGIKRDKLIRQVRERCVHETLISGSFLKCNHCGIQLGGLSDVYGQTDGGE